MEKQNELRILSYFRLNEKERLNCFFEESTLEILKTKRIAVGYAHVAVINEDGTVSAFGNNEHHQCDTQGWSSIVKIAAGDYHTVGLTGDGNVVAVGDNQCGQCNVGDWHGITEIYADRGLTVGVGSDGKLLFSKETEAKETGVAKADNSEKANDKTGSTPSDTAQKNPGLMSKWMNSFSTSKVPTQEKQADIRDENFEYDKMSDNELRIIKYIGSGSVVNVPSNVVSIGFRVFYENKDIETIHLPDSLQLIGSEAFALCPKLKELILPDRIDQVGKNIVYDNTKLYCTANSKTANVLKQKGIPFRTR